MSYIMWPLLIWDSLTHMPCHIKWDFLTYSPRLFRDCLMHRPRLLKCDWLTYRPSLFFYFFYWDSLVHRSCYVQHYCLTLRPRLLHCDCLTHRPRLLPWVSQEHRPLLFLWNWSLRSTFVCLLFKSCGVLMGLKNLSLLLLTHWHNCC